MCKVWPGLRCQDHTSSKIRKLTEQQHRAEQSLSYLEENKKIVWTPNKPPKIVEVTPEEAEKERTKILTNLTSLKEKLDLEECAYALSAGGRRAYAEKLSNPNTTPQEKIDAATKLAAAEERYAIQKEIGVALKDPELTETDKDTYLYAKENQQEHVIQQLTHEKEQILQQLQSLTEQQNPNPEQHSELLTRKEIINEKLRQRKALKQEININRERRRKNIEAKFNWVADKVDRLLRWLLQPQRTARW